MIPLLANLLLVGKLGLALVATATAATSLVLLRKKSNTLEARAERAFRDDLLHSIADWSAAQSGHSAAGLHAELKAGFDPEWRVIRPIPGIARIDLRLQKDSASKVTRTVGIRLPGDDSRIGASSHAYSWDQLPGRFRSAFIRSGEPTLCWTLYDSATVNPAAAPDHAPDRTR